MEMASGSNNSDGEENNEKIIPRNIEDEMKKSYIDYSMSVIVGRALPDVRDGLKPFLLLNIKFKVKLRHES